MYFSARLFVLGKGTFKTGEVGVTSIVHRAHMVALEDLIIDCRGFFVCL